MVHVRNKLREMHWLAVRRPKGESVAPLWSTCSVNRSFMLDPCCTPSFSPFDSQATPCSATRLGRRQQQMPLTPFFQRCMLPPLARHIYISFVQHGLPLTRILTSIAPFSSPCRGLEPLLLRPRPCLTSTRILVQP